MGIMARHCHLGATAIWELTYLPFGFGPPVFHFLSKLLHLLIGAIEHNNILFFKRISTLGHKKGVEFR